jgi:hypothetical protein
MPGGRMPEGCATTSCRRVAPRASRGKSWVLAMLAPKRGLRVAPVPPKAADLTRLARGCRDNGRSGRRNRRFDRTKEPGLVSIATCRPDYSTATVFCPMVGETACASHTEIRTLPTAAINGNAEAIVTFNIRDYVPRDGRVTGLGINVCRPGDILWRLSWRPSATLPFGYLRH